MPEPAARAEALAKARGGALSEPEAREVVRVLAAAGDRDAVDAAVLVATRYPGVAVECAGLLARLRADEGVRALARRLEDPLARPYVLPILAAIPTEEATSALLEALGRDDRKAVLDALKGRRDPRVRAAVAREVREHARGDAAAAVLELRRLGYANAAVSGALAELLQERRFEDRILAVDAVGRTDEPEVGLAVALLLDDKVWQVRLAAAEALRAIRVKEVVGPLIACLEREEHARVRTAVGETLHGITGENLRDFAELWRKWWDKSGKGFVVPGNAPKRAPRAATGETRSVATFYGVPVLSDHVIFVIDLSSSMLAKDDRGGQSRFEKAAEELLAAVEKLGDGARVNVIFFNNDVWRWRKGLTKATKGARAKLAAQLGALRPTGGTCLWDGLAAALADEEVETIFLLSDGQPSGGRFTAPADILRAARELNRFRRAAIHCVAVGVDSPLLRQLAEANDGDYVKR